MEQLTVATTSIHLPSDLLEALDRLAADRCVSRNRIIVESVRETVERHRGVWPPGYLAGDHLGDGDLELLRDGDLGAEIRAARSDPRTAPF